MKQLLALTLFTILIVSACRQDIFGGYRFMDEAKRYIIFPVGSAWVYEDSASLALDTVTVHSMSNGETTTKSPVSDETVELVSGNYTFDTLLINFSFFKGVANDEYVEYAYRVDGGSSRKTSLRFIKGAQIQKIDEGNFGYLSFNFYDSLTVDNSTYYNVIHSSFDPSTGLAFPGRPYYFKETYFAEDIGIVKYVKSDSTVHLLKEYLIQP